MDLPNIPRIPKKRRPNVPERHEGSKIQKTHHESFKYHDNQGQYSNPSARNDQYMRHGRDRYHSDKNEDRHQFPHHHNNQSDTYHHDQRNSTQHGHGDRNDSRRNGHDNRYRRNDHDSGFRHEPNNEYRNKPDNEFRHKHRNRYNDRRPYKDHQYRKRRKNQTIYQKRMSMTLFDKRRHKEGTNSTFQTEKQRPIDKRTALYKMTYSHEELQQRQKHFASTRTLLDRNKFLREFDPNILKLTPEMREIYDKNPHIQQAFVTQSEFHIVKDQFTTKDRFVTMENAPKSEYHSRKGEVKTTEHWGQRKLLMSEIEFLTLYYSQDKPLTVVYAGAAPGCHTNYLSDLFPNLKWVLVDPAPFTTKPTDKIEIIQDYFSQKLAERFANRDDVLFISDVRSVDNHMTSEQRERQVNMDMQLQYDWIISMKPKSSMVKFRLPYTKGSTKYLDGRIFLPVWGGRTTSETRLIIESIQDRQYDHATYENIMFHFNTVTRTLYYPHDIDGIGLDHCFDCRSEIHILSQYLEVVHNYPTGVSLDSDDKLNSTEKPSSSTVDVNSTNSTLDKKKVQESSKNGKKELDQESIEPSKTFSIQEKLRRIAQMSSEISSRISTHGRTLAVSNKI